MKRFTFIIIAALSLTNCFSQNQDLKKAIKHFNAHNYGIAKEEINQAIKQPFESKEELTSAMYYYFMINTEFYSNRLRLSENVEVSEKIAESYEVYFKNTESVQHKKEMDQRLSALIENLIMLSDEQLQNNHPHAYFISRDHAAHLMAEIGKPTNEFYYDLILKSEELNFSNKSVQYCRKLIGNGYKEDFAYKLILEHLYAVEEFAEVDRILEEVNEKFKDNLSFSVIQIQRYIDRKMPHTALVLSDLALEAYPNDLQLLFLNGLLYAKENNHDKSLASFNKVLKMDKDHFGSNREVGRYYLRYSNKGDNSTQALKYLEKAQKINPNDKEATKLLEQAFLEINGSASQLTKNNSPN
ncbi:tetratricopeptide repeat protein [Ekhidna sp.]